MLVQLLGLWSTHPTALGLLWLLLLLLGHSTRYGHRRSVDGELALLDELLHHDRGGEGGEGEAAEGFWDVEV